MPVNEQARAGWVHPACLAQEAFDAPAFVQPKAEPGRQQLLRMRLCEFCIRVPLGKQDVVRAGEQGSELVLPFVIR